MKKIPTIFIRDWNGNKSLVTQEINPSCLWVFKSEGVATRKFDGTAVMVKDGELWVRYDAKKGKQPPSNFLPAQLEPDEETGHFPGWVPAGVEPQYKWQRKAFEDSHLTRDDDGTYEACGPHFQGNPEGFEKDVLVRHGSEILTDAPRTFNGLREYLLTKNIEGIVWHHPGGLMAKIKSRDFGIKRGN